MPLFSPLQRRETPSQPGEQLPSQDGQAGSAFPPALHRCPCSCQDAGRSRTRAGWLTPAEVARALTAPVCSAQLAPVMPGPAWSPPQREPLGKNSGKHSANLAGPGLWPSSPGKSNDAEPESLSWGVCSPGVCGGGRSGAAERRDSLRQDGHASWSRLWTDTLARPHLPEELFRVRGPGHSIASNFEGLLRTVCPVLRASCHLPGETVLGGVPIPHGEDMR